MTQAHFDNARPVKVAVWDLPTRLFHWTLVLLIVFSVTTVKVGGEWMIWHERSGRALLVLLTFRIVWGFIGGEHARWINFICSPFKAIRYAMGVASGRDERYLGHNPLGAYSVIALLAAVATQGITGLFVDDAIVNQGPLVNLVSSKVVEWATRIHHWNERVI